MVGILQTALLGIDVIWLKFHWHCSQGSNEWYTGTGSYNSFKHIRRQAITWTNECLVHWRIYASLGLFRFWVQNVFLYTVMHFFITNKISTKMLLNGSLQFCGCLSRVMVISIMHMYIGILFIYTSIYMLRTRKFTYSSADSTLASIMAIH